MTDEEKSTTETDSTDASTTDHTAAGAVHTAISGVLRRLRRVLTYSTTAVDQQQPIVADGGQSDAKVIGHNTDSGQTIGVWGEVDSTDGCGLATPDDARIDGTLLTNATDFTVQTGTTDTEDAQNIVAGHASNSVTDGAVGATIAGGGFNDGTTDRANVVHDDYGAVGGGRNNQAGSGEDNDATTARYATVSGGAANTASASQATVGGGNRNTASASQATVGGGRLNTASALYATVGGGQNNTASVNSATVGGGGGNTARDFYTTVGGGQNNTASGFYVTIGGGQYNDAQASHATIAGGGSTDGNDSTGNVVYDNYGTVGGGGDNQAGSKDNDAGSAEYATVGGGNGNTASDDGATVGGGSNNTASGPVATVGGGGGNDATGNFNPTVGGGSNNTASANQTTVGGGSNNTASGPVATVGGGGSNTASGRYATIGGGLDNTASGEHATVPGGRGNIASGKQSFAAGEWAEADADWSFVWVDGSGESDSFGGSNDRFKATTSDGSGVSGSATFNVKATNGVRFITSTDNSTVTYIPDGGTGWSNTSSRAVKTNIDPVEPQEALAGVDSMEISTWEYESADEDGEAAGTTHIGPMAEDFHDAFNVGSSDEHINSINADGVALAAIQGLSEQLDEKEECIEELEAEAERKDDRIDDLESRLDRLEANRDAQPADD